MLLLLKTTQLWLNIYENYFLMPEMGAPAKPCVYPQIVKSR